MTDIRFSDLENELVRERARGYQCDPGHSLQAYKKPPLPEVFIHKKTQGSTTYEIEFEGDVSDDDTGTSIGTSSFYPNELRNIVHDFTFQILSKETDVKMSTVFGAINDGNDNLSPDFMKMRGKCVLVCEFATVNSDSVEDLKKSFNIKRIKYETALDNRWMDRNNLKIEVEGIRYCVIVVGRSSVYTNLGSLTSLTATELVFRYNVSKVIEGKLIEAGISLSTTSEERNETRGRTKSVLTTIKFPWDDVTLTRKESNKPFSKEFHMESKKETVNSEMIKETVKESMIKSMSDIKNNFGEFNRELGTYTERVEENLRVCKDKIRKWKKMHSSKTKDKTLDYRSPHDLKSIIQLPLFVPKISITSSNSLAVDKEDHLIGVSTDITFQVWSKAFEKLTNGEIEISEEDTNTELLVALGEKDEGEVKPHKLLYRRVTLDLSEAEKIELAKVGVNGKKYKNETAVKLEREEKKKPMPMDTEVFDFDQFLNAGGEHLGETGLNDSRTIITLNLIQKAYSYHNSALSKNIELFASKFLSCKFGRFATFVSDLAIELSVSLKQHCRENCYIMKKLKYSDIYIIIKPTNSSQHIFFSLLVKKDRVLISPATFGKVFKDCHENEYCFWTDFLSVNMSKLVNLVKFESMSFALCAFWHEFYQVPFWVEDDDAVEQSRFCWEESTSNLDREIWRMFLFSCSVLLVDKHQVEEAITISRFCFMEGFVAQPLLCRPYKMIKKLNSRPRSRLEVWVIHKILDAMKRITDDNGFKVSYDTESKRRTWTGLFNPFTGRLIQSTHQMVSLFYIGYLKNKEENPESNVAGRMYEKILEFEDLCPQNDELLGERDRKIDPKTKKIEQLQFHEFDSNYLKYCLQKTKEKLRKKEGADFMKRIEEKILDLIGHQGIEEFATLKASSDFGPEWYMREVNSKKKYHRKKVVENVRPLITENTVSVLDLTPSALHRMTESGCMHIDIFKKPQHGGLREIYVLGIDERICQFIVETIARGILAFLESETMTHPKNKFIIPENHGRESKISLGSNFITVATSDDAKKWNQGHFVSKFYIMLISFTPEYMHPVIFRVLELWMDKRIMIDNEIIKLFERVSSLNTANEYLNRMYKAYTGMEEEKWMKRRSTYIKTRTGMMQGILHYTSSLLHTISQEGSIVIIQAIMNEKLKEASIAANLKPLKIIISIMQSSDDSSMIISSPCRFKEEIAVSRSYAAFCFVLKSNLAINLGIYPSEKCTRNTPWVMEFNSEFFFHSDLYRPVFRWIAACLNITEQESLSARQEEMSNLLTSILEGGGSFYLTSTIQVSQALSHYRLLGSSVSGIFQFFAKGLMELPDPAYGFFLMDHPAAGGLGGFKYNLWLVVTNSNLEFRYANILRLSSEVSKVLKDAGEQYKTLEITSSGAFMQEAIIRFGNRKNWERIIGKLDLPETWKEDIDEDPIIIFRKPICTRDLLIKLALKMYSPDVQRSLSKGNTIVRIISSGVYVLSRNILSDTATWYKDPDSFSVKKSSLYKKLLDTIKDISSITTQLSTNEKDILFTFVSDYEALKENLNQFQKISGIKTLSEPRKVSTNLEVAETDADQLFTPIKLATFVWFGDSSIPASTRVIYSQWDRLKTKIAWLRDNPKDTLKESPFQRMFQLQNFLARLTRKKRLVHLSGSPVKSRSGMSNVTTAICSDFFGGFKYTTTFDVAKRDQSRGASALMHCLHLTLNGPYTEEYKFKITTDMMTASDTIDINQTIGRSRRNTLAIFQEVLRMSDSKEMTERATELIFKTKLGVLGGWSVIQKFNTKTKYYEGEGIWAGIMDKTTMRLFVDTEKGSNYLKRIEVDTTNFLKTTWFLIREWCKEMSIEVKKKIVNYSRKSLVFKILDNSVVSLNSSLGIPVYKMNVEYSIKFDEFHRISFQLERNTMRLKGESKEGSVMGNRSKKITLLSYTTKDKDIDTDFERKQNPVLEEFFITNERRIQPAFSWFSYASLDPDLGRLVLKYLIDNEGVLENVNIDVENLTIIARRSFSKNSKQLNLINQKLLMVRASGDYDEDSYIDMDIDLTPFEDLNAIDLDSIKLLGHETDSSNASIFLQAEDIEGLGDFDEILEAIPFSDFGQVLHPRELDDELLLNHPIFDNFFLWLAENVPNKRKLSQIFTSKVYPRSFKKLLPFAAFFLDCKISDFEMEEDIILKPMEKNKEFILG